MSTLVGVHNVQYYEHYAVEGVDYESCVFKAQTCTVGSEETKQGQTDIRVRTETEALDRALNIVVSEADIDTALRKVRGRGRIRKVFR